MKSKIVSMVLREDENQEERELLLYGVKNIYNRLIHTTVTLVIGAIFKVLIPLIFFVYLYAHLRECAGGYHAKTKTRCFLISVFIGIIVSLTIKFYNIFFEVVYKEYLVIYQVIISLMLYFNSPVDCENKRLNEEEKKIQKKKMLIYLLIVLLFQICMVLLRCYKLIVAIFLSISITTLLVFCGKEYK